ncbi:MAG: NAD(P)H-binding protein [Hymenobacter sp.]
MKRIAVIGATGLLGAPVTTELIRAGFAVTILAKDEAKARAKFGDGPTYVAGDLRDPAALTRLLTNQDGLYMSLSVKPDSGETDYQPEREGIQAVLAVARQVGLPRLGYLAGLVQRYQGTNGFDWWVYTLKIRPSNPFGRAGFRIFSTTRRRSWTTSTGARSKTATP